MGGAELVRVTELIPARHAGTMKYTSSGRSVEEILSSALARLSPCVNPVLWTSEPPMQFRHVEENTTSGYVLDHVRLSTTAHCQAFTVTRIDHELTLAISQLTESISTL
jgi:hypothetical protein